MLELIGTRENSSQVELLFYFEAKKIVDNYG